MDILQPAEVLEYLILDRHYNTNEHQAYRNHRDEVDNSLIDLGPSEHGVSESVHYSSLSVGLKIA